MQSEREEFGESLDPFEEFEDSYEDEPLEPPPADPYLRQRHERAAKWLDVIADPSFHQTLRDFRLEDPSRLVRRNARRLRERALLLDPSRLMMSTLVGIVMQREEFDGSKALPAWIDDRIDEAITDLLTQDQEDERAGLPVKAPLQSRFAFLVRALQVDPAKVRRTCIRMNELPTPVRKVFFEIVCMLQPVRNLVEAGLGKKSEVTARFRSALEELERADLGFDSKNLHRGAGQPFDLMGGYDA